MKKSAIKAKLALATMATLVLGFSCVEEPELQGRANPGASPLTGPSNLDRNPGSNPGTNPGANAADPNRDGTNTSTSTTTTAAGAECENGTSCEAGESCVSGTNLCVPSAPFRITLSWTAPIDLDLHVLTPRNEELYYRNRISSDGGRLTQDGCIAGRCEAEESPYGETVIWGDFATPGTYEIWAVNYNGGESVPFVIEVEFEGEREVFNGTVGAGQRARSETHVYTIEGVAPEDPNSDTQCKQTLDELGIPWRTWNYTTQTAGGKSCTVEDPITITGPINGITYQYLDTNPGTMNMTCNLALALHRMGDLLKEKNINRVKHIGTFNCRTISGSSSLSNHAFGNGIDLWKFIGTDGTVYSLEDHWIHNNPNPSTDKGQVLKYIAQQMYSRRIFNIILTPDYNSDHDNHFHVDLTRGAHSIRSTAENEFYLDEVPDGHAGCGHDH